MGKPANTFDNLVGEYSLMHYGVKGQRKGMHKFGDWEEHALYAQGRPDPNGGDHKLKIPTADEKLRANMLAKGAIDNSGVKPPMPAGASGQTSTSSGTKPPMPAGASGKTLTKSGSNWSNLPSLGGQQSSTTTTTTTTTTSPTPTTSSSSGSGSSGSSGSGSKKKSSKKSDEDGSDSGSSGGGSSRSSGGGGGRSRRSSGGGSSEPRQEQQPNFTSGSSAPAQKKSVENQNGQARISTSDKVPLTATDRLRKSNAKPAKMVSGTSQKEDKTIDEKEEELNASNKTAKIRNNLKKSRRRLSLTGIDAAEKKLKDEEKKKKVNKPKYATKSNIITKNKISKALKMRAEDRDNFLMHYSRAW